jgi:hypothetical protein
MAFAQQPSEGHLAWLCADGLGDVPHDLDPIHIGVEIVAMEAGIRTLISAYLDQTTRRSLGDRI